MQVLTTAHSPRLKLLTRAARALCPRAHAAAVHPSCLGRARSREQAAAEALDEQLRHIHMMENQLRIVNHWVEDWVVPVKPLQSQHAWLHQMEQVS
jgi:hypothetical protein